MQNQILNKIKGYLNICIKANYVIFGIDNLKNYTKKLYLIIKAKNCGTNLEKQCKEIVLNKNCQILEIENELLLSITNSDNCKIIGIKNKGLSEEIIKLIRGDYIV